MSWPVGQEKASTQYVSNDTDSIAKARRDIKKNLDNVNAIIDTFDISSPVNLNSLQYNATSEKFETATGVGVATQTILLSLDTDLSKISDYQDSAADSQYTIYDGGFSFTGDNNTGVSTFTTDYSYLRFSAGTYIIGLESLVLQTLSSAGGGPNETVETNWKTSTTEYWEGTMRRIDFENYAYDIGSLVTFTEQTDVYLEYLNSKQGNYTHPNLTITRI